MNATKPALCLQHCQRDVNILCFSLPQRCPLCHRDFHSTEMRIPPFEIEPPFQNANKCPFSVVIKPTKGTFLIDYTNDENLHIGLTNSNGVVFVYDEDGVHIGSPNWTQCLSVPILSIPDQTWGLTWNTHLQLFINRDKWSKLRYHRDFNNCYNFVIEFLQYMKLDSRIISTRTKVDFCSKMIIPKTTKAAKYITMYRRIREDGVIVQKQ